MQLHSLFISHAHADNALCDRYVAAMRARAHCSCPSPHQAGFLNADEAGSYVRIMFDGHRVSYDDTLATVDNLGLRLADPCYESMAWFTLSLCCGTRWTQSASFAASHVLVVATTSYASTTWHDQLQATHGVATVQAPAATSCA